MAGRTRERILETSLAMFNAAGEPNVTTNHIADELGISPGNLYYHFRNKDDIVAQLFARYEQRMDEALTAPQQRLPDLEDVWLQLHLVFECMWDFRFLYRDLVDILARNRTLRLRFGRVLERAAGAARQVLRGLVEGGAMHAGSAEIDALVESILLIATFWLDYDAVRHGATREQPQRLAHGIRQVMLLLAPYLREAERAHLTGLAAAYRA